LLLVVVLVDIVMAVVEVEVV
jgi:hypothetical protein